MALRVRIKVIVPRQVLDSSSFVRAIERAMLQNTAPDLKREFKKTVVGWSEAPTFKHTLTSTRNYISLKVSPSGRGTTNYERVVRGTAPHIIRARKRGLLRFQPGYRAATRPRVISSRSPMSYGPYVSAFSVKHPGIEPRDFDIVIAERYENTFVSDMQNAVSNWHRSMMK